jgi:hypothetical protein
MMNMGYSPWSGDRLSKKPETVDVKAEEVKEDGKTGSDGTERTSKNTKV